MTYRRRYPEVPTPPSPRVLQVSSRLTRITEVPQPAVPSNARFDACRQFAWLPRRWALRQPASTRSRPRSRPPACPMSRFRKRRPQTPPSACRACPMSRRGTPSTSPPPPNRGTTPRRGGQNGSLTSSSTPTHLAAAWEASRPPRPRSVLSPTGPRSTMSPNVFGLADGTYRSHKYQRRTTAGAVRGDAVRAEVSSCRRPQRLATPTTNLYAAKRALPRPCTLISRAPPNSPLPIGGACASRIVQRDSRLSFCQLWTPQGCSPSTTRLLAQCRRCSRCRRSTSASKQPNLLELPTKSRLGTLRVLDAERAPAPSSTYEAQRASSSTNMHQPPRVEQICYRPFTSSSPMIYDVVHLPARTPACTRIRILGHPRWDRNRDSRGHRVGRRQGHLPVPLPFDPSDSASRWWRRARMSSGVYEFRRR